VYEKRQYQPATATRGPSNRRELYEVLSVSLGAETVSPGRGPSARPASQSVDTTGAGWLTWPSSRMVDVDDPCGSTALEPGARALRVREARNHDDGARGRACPPPS